MNGHALHTNGSASAPGGPAARTNPTEGASSSSKDAPLYAIPIDQRPNHGTWFTAIFFPLVFDLGMLGINSAQFLLLPLLLLPGGRAYFQAGVDWTKDGFGRLLIAITVLFAPTSLVLSTDPDSGIDLNSLVERDTSGRVTKVNLPPRAVVMSNHQAYLDWMYLWMLACYAGHAKGLTILLKASLRSIPIVGWGMRFFGFIFMHRSWAADRQHMKDSLEHLASEPNRPLWLLIFPEGTITSDTERAKSVKYADKQGVPDLEGVLHPRTTGLLFSLRTLSRKIPDLNLLDITIGYPGVPFGGYPQEWYGLGSVFFRGMPPPVVRVHLRLYKDVPTSGEVPSLAASPGAAGADVDATPEEARAFELWLRDVWTRKAEQVRAFADMSAQARARGVGELDAEVNGACEVVPIVQHTIGDWAAAFGGGGMGTAWVLYRAMRRLF